jgi:hypothetical protein
MMSKLKLTEKQRKFLENNFNNLSEEQINSKVQFSMWGGIPVGKPMELKDYSTMEGIERQLTKANDDNMTDCFIFYAHIYYPSKWGIEKMIVTKSDEQT